MALTYLESKHIVHRDIAARNCLLFPDNELKLTNTALACDSFHKHYFAVDQCRLPIRWMAPECFISVSSILFKSMLSIQACHQITILGSIYCSIRCMVIWHNTMGDHEPLSNITLWTTE
jgi:serine/threonine protein kinase